MSNLFNSNNYPEISRLFKYLAEVQDEGHATFINYSGHVDYLTIKVAEGPDDYENEIYHGGHPTLCAWDDTPVENLGLKVDEVISDIKTALEAHREAERAKYEKLKAKYEPEAEEN